LPIPLNYNSQSNQSQVIQPISGNSKARSIALSISETQKSHTKGPLASKITSAAKGTLALQIQVNSNPQRRETQGHLLVASSPKIRSIASSISKN
jgi:hypothetical protein